MEDTGNKDRREEIFSRAIRAGKRTYFFDVKQTKGKENYLTITESKKRFKETFDLQVMLLKFSYIILSFP